MELSLKKIEPFQNGLQSHSAATPFVSIDFNESYVTGVIAASMLMLGVKGSLRGYAGAFLNKIIFTVILFWTSGIPTCVSNVLKTCLPTSLTAH